ncbi:MAG: helix-turn-helix domain-containing protein [Candidatus Aminicenantes bacterium]|jgi:transcriptional regulator with XRE-family HTH domain
MPGHREVSTSVKILETALMAKDPFKILLKMAEDFIKRGNFEELYNIDVMLTDRFIEYLRNGTIDDLKAFIYDVLAFTYSKIGDQLKASEEGKSYFYRWEHFHDLCDAAIKGYDPKLIKRFITSRKHGEELMAILFRNKDGIRHNELSKKLGISPQYLSKLLREFQEHDLVTRDSKDKVSIIRLGITGREYMKENQQIDEESEDYRITGSTAAVIAQEKEEYESIEPAYEFSRWLNNLNKIPHTCSALWGMRLI